MTILLIEDDENLNYGIALKLTKEGFQVLRAHTIAEARGLFDESVQMVIADISLPDGSGLDFGRVVREKSDAFLIYLTALDQELDIVNGYDSGADDYITKPFSVTVLTARVHALARRLVKKSPDCLKSGEYELSFKELSVRKAGEPLALSRTELLLLRLLMENAGQIVTKEAILDQVWGVDGQFVDDNTVTVNISRLKSKLGTDAISNVRGLGYLWTKEVIKM